MKVVDPYSGESAQVEEISDVESLFDSARCQLEAWLVKSVAERVCMLRGALEKFLIQADALARLISEEMGKPLSQAKLEIERSIEEWVYMLDNAERFLAPEVVGSAEVHFAPLGVVAVISPWNFPCLLPLRGIVPALLAGNSVLFKPSELSPRVGMCVANCMHGVAPLVVAIGGKELGAKIVSLPVAAIAFTGSTSVGKAIAREASQTMKRVVLELGGLDAAIVLSDADIQTAAQEIVRSNARNSGQVCNAVKRVLVHESVYEKFLEEALNAAQGLTYGDPLDPSTDIGPLVSEQQRDRVKGFLDDALAKGAKSYSRSVPDQGFFFPQTILTHLAKDSRLLFEEPFGPLLPILPFSAEQEAVQVANNTRFGLTASVWTRDASAMKRIAGKLDVGMVRHNSHTAMSSGIPWGGCKESGIGRMKTKEGLREFTNVKVIA